MPIVTLGQHRKNWANPHGVPVIVVKVGYTRGGL